LLLFSDAFPGHKMRVHLLITTSILVFWVLPYPSTNRGTELLDFGEYVREVLRKDGDWISKQKKPKCRDPKENERVARVRYKSFDGLRSLQVDLRCKYNHKSKWSKKCRDQTKE
jgi:hypothetical protein